MPDKSFVTMEQHVCLACGKPFDTGALLLDRRLRDTFERHTVTGWDLCPEHQAQVEDGYIIIVGCDPEKTTTHHSVDHGERVRDPSDAYRTGSIAALRRSVWEKVFDTPAPDTPVVFAEQDVLDKLEKMQGE